MSGHSILDIYRFTTLGAPERERFDAWAMAMSMCEYESPVDTSASFDAEFHAIRFGPFVLTSYRWIRSDQTVSYRAIRSARKILADGLDYFYLMFQLAGSAGGGFGRCRVQVGASGRCLYDMSLPFDCVVTTGDVVGLLIRRDTLRSLNRGRDDGVVDSAMGVVLAEHLLTLLGNMEKLGADDIPYIVRATSSLLRAGLTRSGDTPDDDLSEMDQILMRDARRFIDANLLRADLAPEMIGESLGVSRAKLYTLFRGSGGIMRQVQRDRLDRAYDVLTDPGMPKVRIAEIAWRHGFVDEKYFSRMFRARFGCTPREAAEGRRIAPLRPRMVGERGDRTFVQWLKDDQEGHSDNRAFDMQAPDRKETIPDDRKGTASKK